MTTVEDMHEVLGELAAFFARLHTRAAPADRPNIEERISRIRSISECLIRYVEPAMAAENAAEDLELDGMMEQAREARLQRRRVFRHKGAVS